MKRVLVAGLGNVFSGDDGFGVEVVGRLAGIPLPPSADVLDLGVRGFDLAYALADGYDAAVLVDTLSRGQPAGTVYVFEPDLEDLGGLGIPDGHGMQPAAVLSLVTQLGAALPQLFVVGCEPATFGPEEGLLGLSEPVRAAVGEAVQVVSSLVERLTDHVEVG